MKKNFGALLVVAMLLGLTLSAAAQTTPLTTLNFDIVGIGLNAGPDYQAVPKGIATQVNTSVDTGAFDVDLIVGQLPNDYRVVAELSGPAFLTPLTLETMPGKPFDIPTLALNGKHTLNNIRLVDGQNTTLFGAVPQAVVIESISDPLITEVKTRELSLQELQDRGVTFDSSNFTAYEFTAAITTESGQVPLTLPVIIPNEVKLPNPEDIQTGGQLGLPTPQVEFKPPQGVTPQLPPNLEVKPFVMKVKQPEGVSETIELPPIPGVVVIPGNIGFLHQYFSALAIVSNGAPELSGLTIRDLKARIILPDGADLTAGTDASPGDDPLRLAKGTDGFFPREMVINQAGPDGQFDTGDDLSELAPGISGQADFTIEGLKEGTHKVEFEISAILDGLPIGPVEISGSAVGAVLVRNPDFALTMSHPQTVRTGEAYDLFITVTNTGKTTANLVSVHLDPRALSGAAFAEGQLPDLELDSIAPGSSGTVRYRLISQRTGAVTATVFQSEELKGSFNLRAGVGERGIPLSPDSLILPYTDGLSPELVSSVVGLLGQAWSVATAPAGALPADVTPIAKQTVRDRAYDLSEAGLRLLIGDLPHKTLQDLTFDLFGSDKAVAGFDELRRTSTQGLKVRQALTPYFEAAATDLGLLDLQTDWADKVSYRPGHLSVATTSAPLRVQLTDPVGYRLGSLNSDSARREIPYGDQFILGDNSTERASLSVVTALQEGSYRLNLSAEAAANFDLGIVWPDATGVLHQLRFDNLTLAAGAKAVLELQRGVIDGYLLQIDIDGDGSIDTSVAPSVATAILDTPPQIVTATQIVPGFGPGGDKHGRNIAVLFNETVTPESARDALNYAVDTNRVKSASLQPGGRMAFLLLRDGIGPFFDRTLSVDGLIDMAGLPMNVPQDLPIRITAQGPAAVVDGVVREANGAPVPNATVRLMQYIWHDDGYSIEKLYAIFSEKQAGADGSYHFDYVLQNHDPAGPFRIEEIHPGSGEVGQATTVVNQHGQQLNLDIFMQARGSLDGTIYDDSGNAVAGATAQVTTLFDQRSFNQTTDAQGHYAFSNLSVGAFRLKAIHQASLSEGTTMGTLPEDGAALTQDLTIYPRGGIARGDVTGRVLGVDGVTPRAGVVVVVKGSRYTNWKRSGSDGSFAFTGVHAGAATFEAYDESSGEQVKVQGTVLDSQTVAFNLIFEGTATIVGSVIRDDGKSASGLLVAASFGDYPYSQNRLTETDADGLFQFDLLPVGDVSLQVIDPHDYNKRIASTTVTLLNDGGSLEVPFYVAGAAFASGSLNGTVYHRDGTPWPGVEVRLANLSNNSYIPCRADASGQFTIPNLPLKTHILIVFEKGEVANVKATLWYDGQAKTVDLKSFGFGSIGGTVYDDLEKTMPTGADVTLTSMQPNFIGWLVYDYNHPQTVKADAQNGRFRFASIYEGHYLVQTSNVFRPTPVSISGDLTAQQTIDLDLVLQGSTNQSPDSDPNPDTNPPPVNAMGSIAGQVQLPDGTPAAAGVQVTTTIGGADVTVTTDGNGAYQFSPILPQGNHLLQAFDPITSLKWQGYVSVPGGGEVNKTIVLLGRAALQVLVQNADGKLAADASVSAIGSGYPNDQASGVTDADGLLVLENLTIGSYALSASGTFGRGGRGEAILSVDGETVSAVLSLTPSGTVTGIFVRADGVTPISGGQIKLLKGTQTLAFSSTSSDPTDPATLGQFQMDYVPLGDFVLEGFDPVTQRSGRGSGRLGQDGETVNVKVTVLPRGTVQGVVLNYGGTTPIERARVSIRVSGASSYNYSTTTGPDGHYLFAGVPAGRFDLEATDPSNGLKGSVQGSLSYENEAVDTELRIAPTGAIEGRVLMPDGLTPATNVRVVFQGKSYLIDVTDGSFAFSNLPAGRSYTLTAYDNGSNRAQSRTLALAGDGDLVIAEIVLRGVGLVEGRIFDTDGITPLYGAEVRMRAAGLVSADYTLYTDQDGHYLFSDVPAGSFTLNVSHPQRVTAASASGTLSREGEMVTMDLIIGPVAAVAGRVLLADGVTPAAGGGVRYNDNGGRSFTAQIASNGTFRFNNIPVPADFSLYMADAQDLGFNRASGSLSVNGQLFDVGTIVLDDQVISIVSVDPSAGTVDVPVDRAVTLLFSEPFNPATVNLYTTYLTQGSTKVVADYVNSADQRTLTLTPQTPLIGFSLYKLVVTTGVKDLVGRPLSATYVSTFTTIDNVPPAVTAVSPTNGMLQVPLDGVARLAFSESLDPVSLDGIVLQQGGSVVAVQRDLVQEGRVVILTPLSPLATNTQYAVNVSSVQDLPGNVMSGTFSSSFDTLDTIVPMISSLTLAEGATLISGANVGVSAVVADPDVAFVDFSVDNVLAASDHNAPFGASLHLDHDGEVIVKAVAQDRVGNRGPAELLVLNVATDQPPTAEIVTPADGAAVDSGAQFSVNVIGRDDLGVTSLTLTTTGALNSSQARNVSGTTAATSFSLTLPATTLPGSTLKLKLVATDSAGHSSVAAKQTLVVRDGVAPQLTLTSPGTTSFYLPGETGSVTVMVSDLVGVSELSCNVDGSATGSGSWPFAPTVKQAQQELTFTVNADAAPHATVTIHCTGQDAAGNMANTSLALQVADIVPPVVVTSNMEGKSWGVPVDRPLTISFNEALNSSSFNTLALQLITETGAEVIAGQTSFSNDKKSVLFTPATALVDETRYVLTLSAGAVADLSGNLFESDYVVSFITLPANTVFIQNQGAASAPYVLAGGIYQQVSIDNSYVVLEGALGTQRVSLTNNSVLTHLKTGNPATALVEIAAEEIAIDSSSKIDVSGKGYLGGAQPGNSSDYGRTLENTISGGSKRYSGGSYGGYGGQASSYAVNQTYGDLRDPNEYGSGGGGYVSPGWRGGNGGGLLRLSTIKLILDGVIAADGMTASCAGSGSGGGVRLDVGLLTGNGSIFARGANNSGCNGSSGGGGGRIAVYYDDLTMFLGQISAAGGKSGNSNYAVQNGGAGTVYLKSGTADFGDLLIDNGGVISTQKTAVADLTLHTLKVKGQANVRFDGTVVVTDEATFNAVNNIDFNGILTFENGLLLNGMTGTLTIGSEATLTDLTLNNSQATLSGPLHMSGTLALQNSSTLTGNQVFIDASLVSIDATSRIDVRGGGYAGGYSRGSGRTISGNTGSVWRNGGSYGGFGGVYSGSANAVYGDPTDPNEFGSGGGGGYYSSWNIYHSYGGAGGGLIRLRAATLQLDGQIVADGKRGSSRSGGGSGGGIRIDATTLRGQGTIYARGGDGKSGGGGGRIAIYYKTLALPVSNIQARGGNGGYVSRNGGAGTIYLTSIVADYGDLIIDNGGVATNRTTPIPGMIFASLEVKGGAVLYYTDQTAPHVIMSSIAEDSFNIPLTQSIEIFFDEPLALDTIAGSVSLVDTLVEQTVVGASVLSEDRKTITFVPQAALTPSAYLLTITTAVTDLSHNHLTADFVLHFATEGADTAAPTVTAIQPADAEVTRRNDGVIVSLSDDLSGVDAAATIAGVEILGPNGLSVAGQWQWQTGAGELIFVPVDMLVNGSYQITLQPTDRAGNSMTIRSSFTVLNALTDADGVVSEYDMERVSAGQLIDTRGRFNGDLYGPLQTIGAGGALGEGLKIVAGQYVVIPQDIASADQFGIAFFERTPPESLDGGYLISDMQDSSNLSIRREPTSGGVKKTYTVTVGGVEFGSVQSESQVYPTGQYHFVVINKFRDGRIEIFVNDVSVPAVTGAGSTFAGLKSDLILGAIDSSQGDYAGTLDQVTVALRPFDQAARRTLWEKVYRPGAGLVASYSMDSPDGSILVDSLGLHDGLIVGASSISGIDGQALAFSSATQDFSELPAGLTTISEGSISLSVRLDDTAVGSLLSHRDSVDRSGMFSLETVGGMVQLSTYDGTVWSTVAVSTVPIEANTYVRISLVWDAFGKKLYLNDQQVANATGAITLFEPATKIFLGNTVDLDSGISGDIDDLRIYDRALSDQEIGNLGVAP